MATIINASTSAGLVQTADTSGTLELQSNGNTKLTVSATGAYGSLVSGTAQASTSGTSIDFTGIPAWVKRITVMFSGVSLSGTSDILIQLGDSGGVEITGYLGASADGPTLNVTSYTAGFGIRSGTAAATIMGSVIINNFSSNTWVASGTLARGNGAVFITTAGSKDTSATLDRIRITTVNGTDTFDAGSINIMYEG
jgi:hypothetical protein